MPLPDVLPSPCRVLFVGINPGLGSERRGHHFGGPGNPFWRLLHAAGFTPRLFAPEEDVLLGEWGWGLVNLCDRPTRTAAELTRGELEQGRVRLVKRVERVRPRVVALVGISLFQAVFPGVREPGPGPKEVRCDAARVFVLPNPSGLNASYPSFADKLVWFEALAEWMG